MPSIFHADDLNTLLRRIETLEPTTRPLWGKMQVGQMLAHCQAPLLVATGDLKLERGLVGILFGRLAKKQLAGPKPFGKGMPTAPQFRVQESRDFAREREVLLRITRELGRKGPAGLTQKPHPFFGPMTVSEWDTLQWKHLDHHLRQFGV